MRTFIFKNRYYCYKNNSRWISFSFSWIKRDSSVEIWRLNFIRLSFYAINDSDQREECIYTRREQTSGKSLKLLYWLDPPVRGTRACTPRRSVYIRRGILNPPRAKPYLLCPRSANVRVYLYRRLCRQREWLVKKNEDVKYFILTSARESDRRSISALSFSKLIIIADVTGRYTSARPSLVPLSFLSLFFFLSKSALRSISAIMQKKKKRGRKILDTAAFAFRSYFGKF